MLGYNRHIFFTAAQLLLDVLSHRIGLPGSICISDEAILEGMACSQ